MITLFEAYNIGDEKYKSIIRKCLNDIIKPNIDKLDETTELILKLFATNRTLKNKYGKNIILDDKYFEKNAIYILDNIKIFFDIVFKTYLNGVIGELVVKDLLESDKFNFKVTDPTDQENIVGADLITTKKGRTLKHQVKFIYEYSQPDESTFKIKNKVLDIKKRDKYDYIWFFVNDKNEVVLFKKEDINIEETDEVGYSIKYTKIKKYEIDVAKVEEIREKVSKTELNFDENIDTNSEKLSIIRTKLELLNSVKKYNL